jgi:hypothetical protein
MPNGTPFSMTSVSSTSENKLRQRISFSHSSPSLASNLKFTEGDTRHRKISEGANRKPRLDIEIAPESDRIADLSVTDKRKSFAFKSMKRKQNLLAPKVLTDIGERSDNSDQSFDYGDGVSATSPSPGVSATSPSPGVSATSPSPGVSATSPGVAAISPAGGVRVRTDGATSEVGAALCMYCVVMLISLLIMLINRSLLSG